MGSYCSVPEQLYEEPHSFLPTEVRGTEVSGSPRNDFLHLPGVNYKLEGHEKSGGRHSFCIKRYKINEVTSHKIEYDEATK